MIEEDLKRIREAENDALRRIEEAEKRSKEEIEESKKIIRKEIEEERKKVLMEIDEMKWNAEEEGKREAEKIIEDYRARVREIEKIDEGQIKHVAREVMKEILG